MPSDPTYIGNAAATALRLAEGYPKRSREGSQWVFTWRYWCPSASAHDGTGGLIPARNANMPNYLDYTGTNYYLNHVEVSATEVPKMVYVDLKYTKNSGSSGGGWYSSHSNGDIEKSVNKTMREIDKERAIEAGLIAREDFPSDSQKTVGIVGIEYVYTYFSSTFDWTEENILSYLCEVGIKPTSIDEMPGITDVGDYEQWLCKGQSVREDGGGITQISTTYAWDRLSWEGFAFATPAP
jgi:hypothetical protein